MRKAVKLRTLTVEEETEIRRFAASRKEPHSLVQRAKFIVELLDYPKLFATHSAIEFGFRGEQSGITWVRRFNAEGYIYLTRPSGKGSKRKASAVATGELVPQRRES